MRTGISDEASTPLRTPLAGRCARSTAQQAQHSSAATGSVLPSRPARQLCEAAQVAAPRQWLETGMVTLHHPRFLSAFCC